MKLRQRQVGLIRTGWIVLPLLVVAGVLFVWNWTAQNTWPVQWVEVRGPFRHVSAEEIRAHVAPLTKVGFFAIDTLQVRRMVEGMPWIRSAEIRRRWPDTVVVSVVEQVPVARWHDRRLVNDAGELFEATGTEGYEALPMLGGPEGLESQVFEFWQACAQVLLPAELRITQMIMDERRSWQLTLDDGTQLALGRRATMARVRRLARVYGHLVRNGAVPAYVDLRYTNGLAVRRDSADQAPRVVQDEDSAEQRELRPDQA